MVRLPASLSLLLLATACVEDVASPGVCPDFCPPTVIQVITYANPMRYFLVIIRGIFLKGIGMEIVWHQLVALAIIGTTLLVTSSLRFRKRME